MLVLVPREDHVLLDNLAVDPRYQGRGLGRLLLGLTEAETRRLGLREVRLYTHVLMTENQALYAHCGYVEYDRRTVGGRERVFMRKALGTRAG